MAVIVLGGKGIKCALLPFLKKVSWNLSSLERYIMLQGLAGISTETMFSEQPVPDRLKLRLEELKATGVPYGKKQLAEQLGVKPYQLDIFARNYGIEPFWKGAKGNQPKTDMPKIYLTEQERMEIQTKAKKLRFAHTGDFIKSCVRQQMETEKT